MSNEKKYYVNQYAVVDDNVEIGEGTKIWHFSHIQSGAKIGKNCVLGQNVNVGNNVSIGILTIIRVNKIRVCRFVRIGSFNFIDTEIVELGEDTRINEKVIIGGIRTPDSHFKIGKRGLIMEYSFINPTKSIILGDDCGIGGHCLLFTHSSWLSQIDGFPVNFASISIGNRVWIAWRTFILPGVNIGDDVIISANSVVTTNIPSKCLAAGMPAKIITYKIPFVLSDKRRLEIIKNIFSDFISFMSYNGFNIYVKEIEPSDKIFTFRKDKKCYEIYYSTSMNSYKSNLEDNLLILDNINITENFNYSFRMIINLKTKERIGKSNIGEEFVNFTSTYGIRFNRLD